MFRKTYLPNGDGTYRTSAGECLSCFSRRFPPQPESLPSPELLAIAQEREPTEDEVQGLRRVLIDIGGLYDDYDLTAEQAARLRRKGIIRFDPELTQIALLPEEEERENTSGPLPIAAIYTAKNGAYSDNEDDPETSLTTLLKESLSD